MPDSSLGQSEAWRRKPVRGIRVVPCSDVESVWVEVIPPLDWDRDTGIQMTPALARELAEHLTSAAHRADHLGQSEASKRDARAGAIAELLRVGHDPRKVSTAAKIVDAGGGNIYEVMAALREPKPPVPPLARTPESEEN